MKIAVTTGNGVVFQHFGATPEFTVYTVEQGKVTGKEVVSTAGTGHEALAGILASLGVEALICGGIGGGARAVVASLGIALYPGVSGPADDAAAAFASQTLQYQPDFVCGHHHGEHTCHH